jgi:anaerobic ribonucleoside-triphosphate reductase activating protein
MVKKKFKFTKYQIVFQEHPWHVSLLFEISNCPHKCEGCHSPELQNDIGFDLTEDIFLKILSKYETLFDNVIFFGGENFKEELINLLKICKRKGINTTLWTGSSNVDDDILRYLDYLKTGEYREDLGPIGTSNTNQKYFRISDGMEIKIKENSRV